jgi:hypothetical protein
MPDVPPNLPTGRRFKVLVSLDLSREPFSAGYQEPKAITATMNAAMKAISFIKYTYLPF